MQQCQWQADGWEPTARIGLIVPHADVGPESEFRAILPDTIALFGSRMHFSAMRAGGVMDPKIPHGPVQSFTDPPFADDAAELLAAAPIEAIGCGFTSSAYKLGVAGEAKFVDRVRERTRGIPLASTCHAAAQALRSLGARTLALVNPPWFDAELDELGRRYFTELGFEVVHHAPCGLPSSQREITAEAMFEWVAEQVMPAEPDAVFIAGNGLRAVGVIDALERRFDIPVLTANQVLLWYTLHLAAAQPRISGYGRLFERRP